MYFKHNMDNIEHNCGAMNHHCHNDSSSYYQMGSKFSDPTKFIDEHNPEPLIAVIDRSVVN
jgi:hypothetical protein